MNNVHPIFKPVIAHIAPPVAPSLRQFAVSIKTATAPEDINVMAYTSCDAICKAIDLFFDGDEAMPVDGLVVIARPLDTLPRPRSAPCSAATPATSNVQRHTAEDWKSGRVCDAQVLRSYGLRDLIWQQLANRSVRMKVGVTA